MRRDDLPSIQPDAPRHVSTVTSIGGEGAVFVLESPEEERVIGVAGAIHGDVSGKITRKGESYVR